MPPKVYSTEIKPVALPPGRAKLLTKPAPTGSATKAKTIGTLRVACSKGGMDAEPMVKMRSGVSATNSVAYLCVTAALPALHR